MDYKKLIVKYDKENMLSYMRAFPEHCRDALEITSKISVSFQRDNCSNIFIQGMGGSGISGAITRDLLRGVCKLPIYVSNSYDIPEFVNDKTLAFFVSYSGNTEETLAAFSKAKERNAKIIGISSGGKLLKECPLCIKVPAGNLPRNMLGYLTIPILAMVERIGLLSFPLNLPAAIDFLANESYTAEKIGKKIAKSIYKKIPVLYASDCYSSLVWRIHGQLAENSGIFSHCNVLPEMNHNEIVGFRYYERQLAFLFFRDYCESDKMKKRFEFTRKIVSKNSKVLDIGLKGKTIVERLFYGIMIGDFASYYLALHNKKDPSENENITKLKRILAG
ncbi:MAG: bifunctional phosphoglucose/phosphomannose isomerase [Candidatus Diapherotrites archaeon]|nr:bifunctional phosphoglucose/phosphomannose isomerase [Candidatus Diapherotrites archaeon]